MSKHYKSMEYYITVIIVISNHCQIKSFISSFIWGKKASNDSISCVKQCAALKHSCIEKINLIYKHEPKARYKESDVK